MKQQKKIRKRCSVCGTPLVSAVELEYGLCVKHLHSVEDSPRKAPKRPKADKSKKPSSIRNNKKADDLSVDATTSSIHESNNVSCCTRITEKASDFLEEYARKNGITLSELIRGVLLEWMEAMK